MYPSWYCHLRLPVWLLLDKEMVSWLRRLSIQLSAVVSAPLLTPLLFQRPKPSMSTESQGSPTNHLQAYLRMLAGAAHRSAADEHHRCGDRTSHPSLLSTYLSGPGEICFAPVSHVTLRAWHQCMTSVHLTS